ncbi:hypothetical protein FACS1894113_0270 [Alphaproteobacteria bacterium]|nr:hypothetical protein FACS1894113_0270 [Alphaproteobacteria bacterium]
MFKKILITAVMLSAAQPCFVYSVLRLGSFIAEYEVKYVSGNVMKLDNTAKEFENGLYSEAFAELKLNKEDVFHVSWLETFGYEIA